MKDRCAHADGCRNLAVDDGLCRRHLRERGEAKAAEVESSPVGPSVDRGYHERAAYRHVASATGEHRFTKAYLALAERGRILERDDPIVAPQEDEPCI